MTQPSQQTTIITSSASTLELDNGKETFRFELTNDVHSLGRDPDWADLCLNAEGWGVLSRRQAILKREGSQYRIFDGDGTSGSSNGIFVNQTRVDPVKGRLLTEGTQLYIGLLPENRVGMIYREPQLSTKRPTTAPSKWQLNLRGLQDWPVEIGRAPTPNRYSSLTLDAPTVSRLHAKVSVDAKGRHFLQDMSSNGTFVNGDRTTSKQRLTAGDVIRIGPFALSYQGDRLILEDSGNQIRLDAHNLVRTVKDKKGNMRNILNNISLVIEPGQLVALVGGSGAGKSTLMKSLLSVAPITSGTVFLNGENLRDSWEIYRTQIGYVPQDDIVHTELTVDEVLRFACKLRLPPDADVETVVEKTLMQIRLGHVRNTLVRDLSGGQRKRVSIGVELLADPKLFFLDEPTSGLDPGLDKEMMGLLRELANQGRTIVLVTHATANIEVCDRVAFLGRGGYLCYFGPPQNAPNFFELPLGEDRDFADIYLKLDAGETDAETRTAVTHWHSRYSQSNEYQQYVGSLLSAGQSQMGSRKSATNTGISPVIQLGLLAQRYLRLIVRDRLSQVLTLISGPIAIALTGLILRNASPLARLDPLEPSQAPLALRLTFVFTCIAIWIGLSSAVREIVKEAAIYQRERLINLGLIPFLGSKMLIWIGIAALQSVLMAISITIFFAGPTEPVIPWILGVWVTNFLTVLASVALSLSISSAVKTENAANSLLPLVMIPQIIFSGVLFNLEGIAKPLSWLTISRWTNGAYGSLVGVNKMVPPPVQMPDGTVLDPAFSPTPTYDATLSNIGLNWMALMGLAIAYLCLTLCLQKRKDVI